MFDPLFDVVTAVLAWFYSLIPSYGVAIGLLTLTAVVAVTPLTLRMTRNMLKMQQHMPELKKLQNQYRGDRQAMNEASMAFYKENGLNPVGCVLPMLVQGPIFLVMYRVVDGLTRRTTEIGTQLGFTSRRFADSVSGGVPEYAETTISRSDLRFDPDFLSRDSDLYEHLSGDVEMLTWGVDLSRSASAVISENIVSALPYLLMLVVVLVTSLYQQRQIQGRQDSSAVNPQQQMMMKLIPYMLPVFSYVMPAAVVTYFIVSNMVRIAQQAYITRSFYRGEDSLGAQVARQRASATDTDEETDPKPRSPRATTERKGAPTPKRDAASKATAPTRRRGPRSQRSSDAPARGSSRTQRSSDRAPSRRRARGGDDDRASSRRGSTSQSRSPSGRGRTGKAPARGRSGSSRTSSGRVTPPGSGAKRPSQNRSRNKRKRR